MTSGTTATQSSDNMAARIIGLVSLALLVNAIVFAFITAGRKSIKGKIEKQLTALKDEAIVFHKHTNERSDITRDEIGLWRDVEQDNKANSHHKAIGVSVVVAVLAVLAAPFIINQVAGRNNTNNQTAIQQDNQVQASQAQCLNDAYAAYEKSWQDADKDGDGSLSFQDGATNITTSYYDAAIGCYRTYKTADSNDYIADYQTSDSRKLISIRLGSKPQSSRRTYRHLAIVMALA